MKKINDIMLSVVVPIYNSSQYLEQCLISICNQTFVDIEIILIDDCSTDNSLEIIKNYAANDKRIKIVTNKEHKGAGYSRNIGIDVSKGKYLLFLDSDDIYETNYIEKMYLQAELKNADIVFSKYNIIDYNGKIIATEMGFWKITNNEDINYALCKKSINIFTITTPAPWNKLYRKNFVIDNFLRFQNTRIANDVSFFKKSFFLANSIYVLDICSVNYRENWMGNISSSRYIYTHDIFNANYNVLNFLKQHQVDNKILEDFYISALSNYKYEFDRIPKMKIFNKLVFCLNILKFFPILFLFKKFKFLFNKIVNS